MIPQRIPEKLIEKHAVSIAELIRIKELYEEATKHRSDAEIVQQTNVLARSLIGLVGYSFDPHIDLWRNRHDAGNSRQRLAWDLACEAQQQLTQTDPNDALANLGWE